jgi:hypothetical protein
VREISRAEAIVVGDLLAGADRRRDGLDPHIPSRTRQAIRQRFLERGALHECFVPNPSVWGRPIVTFVLLEPFAEARTAALREWGSTERATDAWSFQSSLFGVFFLRDTSDALELRKHLGSPEKHRDSFFLDCDSRKASVPVFFDFEATWVRVTGLSGTLAYPQPLPSSGSATEDTSRTRSRIAHHELAEWMGEENSGGLPHPRVNRFIAGARRRRLQREGRGEFRSFLEPDACSRLMSHFPETVAFVRGALREGREPPELFRALVADCRINPFLFATDGVTVLFACLAMKGEGGPTSVPRTETSRLSVIGRFLSQVVVLREPLSSLRPLLDHQYARPFSESPPGR